jgi:hypothetical protein
MGVLQDARDVVIGATEQKFIRVYVLEMLLARHFMAKSNKNEASIEHTCQRLCVLLGF